MFSLRFAAAGGSCASCGTRVRTVKPNTLFSRAVLQRGISVPVWGTAARGEKVTVVQGQEATTTARDGKWDGAAEADGSRRALHHDDHRHGAIEVKDILVGDVWVCSGQSNMQCL